MGTKRQLGVTFDTDKNNSKLYALFGIKQNAPGLRALSDLSLEESEALETAMEVTFMQMRDAASKVSNVSVIDDFEDYVPAFFEDAGSSMMIYYPISILKEDCVKEAFLDRVRKLVEFPRAIFLAKEAKEEMQFEGMQP